MRYLRQCVKAAQFKAICLALRFWMSVDMYSKVKIHVPTYMHGQALDKGSQQGCTHQKIRLPRCCEVTPDIRPSHELLTSVQCRWVLRKAWAK